MPTPATYAQVVRAYQYDGTNASAVAAWFADFCTTHPAQIQTYDSWSEDNGVLTLVVNNHLSTPVLVNTGEFLVLLNGYVSSLTQEQLDVSYQLMA